jgi:molybdate transport system substrate-binding protein
LWNRCTHLVLGDFISQAAQFATTETPSAASSPIPRLGPASPTARHALLPEADHPPLRQRMVLLKRAGLVVERF